MSFSRRPGRWVLSGPGPERKAEADELTAANVLFRDEVRRLEPLYRPLANGYLAQLRSPPGKSLRTDRRRVSRDRSSSGRPPPDIGLISVIAVPGRR